MLFLRTINHFILEAYIYKSQRIKDCVRGEICFKEIVSNTRLNLNHPSFTDLGYEFLIICKFLLICIQYLFIVFVYYINLCYYLYLDLSIVHFALLRK